MNVKHSLYLTKRRVVEQSAHGGKMVAKTSNAGSFAVPPNILLQELPDQGLVFLDLGTEEYFGLDEVGSRMYEVLLSEGSVDRACDVLLEEYEVAAETLRADLDAFVAQLLERGLIVHEPR